LPSSGVAPGFSPARADPSLRSELALSGAKGQALKVGATDIKGGEEDFRMSEPTKEELMARIAELEKQAGGKKSGKLEFKVGDKGGVSVYGLGRFPVTLYYEQWTRLLDAGEDLRAYLEANKSRLKLKQTT